MTFQDMSKFLNKMQEDRFQTKVLNAILACFSEIKRNEQMIVELQEKVNQIINGWNEKESDAPAQDECAEALNPEIEGGSSDQLEDLAQWGSFDEEDITVEMENDALVDQPAAANDLLEDINVEEKQ